MRITGVIALTVIVLWCGGCASIQNYPTRLVDPKGDLQAIANSLGPDMIDRYYKEQREEERRRLRDEIINCRILALDLAFYKFQQDLTREGVLSSVATDWAVLALSGASAVAPVKETKTVLSAIATGITGAKGSVDKNVFIKKTLDALLTKMQADRKEVLTRIRRNMQGATSIYPLSAGLIDLEEYFQAGTLPGALMGIAITSGETIKRAEEEQKLITESSFLKDDAGDILWSFWWPRKDLENKAFKKKLAAWMREKKIKTDSITIFIRGKDFAKDRDLAIKEKTLFE